MVMVILWVASEKSPLAIPGGKKEDGPRPRRSFHLRAAVIICLLVASGSTYYSFFACFFLLVAGVLGSMRRRRLGPLFVAGGLAGVICLGAVLNFTPSLYHGYKNGRNPEVAHRSYAHAELYGMKISQLLLPIQHHRWSFFAEFKDRYNKSAPLANENDVSSFGFIGSIGFLLLIAAVFSDRLRSWDAEIHSLSYLNLSGILLATIGGFSTLVAFFFPHIRAYNRISVVLAFFALLAFSLGLEKLFPKVGQGRRKVLGAFCLLLLGIGILDQTSPFFTPPHEKNKIRHAQQAAFIGQVESRMPPRTMIFQLPYVPFPENPPLHRMEDYEHLGGGYLYSKELRWSYGAMKGRAGDAWQKFAVSQPVGEFLEMICRVGFEGLYIDRYGYEDGALSWRKSVPNFCGCLRWWPAISATSFTP